MLAFKNKMMPSMDAVRFDRITRPLPVPRNHGLIGLHIEADKS